MGINIKTRIVKRTEIDSDFSGQIRERSYYYVEREDGFFWKYWRFVKLFSTLETAELYRNAFIARNGVKVTEEVIS